MKKLKSSLLGVIGVLVFFSGYSQNTLWYFGRGGGGATSAGLDFSPLPATAANGQTSIDFYESVTVMDDGSSGLLFYSDGTEIYDKSHAVMSGAGGIQGAETGGGLGSAVQGVISFKKPGATDDYYVVTTGAIGSGNGIRYHEIDMSQAGNGTVGNPHGVVTSKNNLISATSGEMLDAAGNCDSVVIIGHQSGSTNFTITYITSAGVVSNTTQAIGPSISGSGLRGSIDINSTRDKVILSGGWPTKTWLFDFDFATGTLSNPVDLWTPSGGFYTYRALFSPDGTKIYLSGGSFGTGIKHYNIATTTFTDVTTTFAAADMAIGEDGKIYVGTTSLASALGTISTPDAASGPTCTWSSTGFSMAGGYNTSFGLPDVFKCASVVCPDTSISQPSNVCVGQTENLADNETTSESGTWTITSSPAGSNPAVITGGNVFDASASNTDAGTYTVRFTLTTPVGGCPSYAERNIVVNALPVVTLTLTDDAACVDEAAFALGGGSPAGGTYSGTGVTNPNFDPATAGVGSHTITYSYTDGNGCSNSATDNMTVNALPVVTLTLTDDAACVDEAAFALGGGSPAGGTYSGTGVTNPNFDPATAGVGSHTITYSYTDGNGCSSSATDNMTVNALPVVTLTLTDDAACVDEAAFALGGGSPAGGTYSGTGVTNPNFDPATAGVGSHTITYSYTDGNGCSNSATDNMTVNALPVVTLTLTDDAACVDEAAFALGGGSPAGGTYSGTGVTNPNFDPATAGVGSHTITYSYTDGNGCSSSATDNMTVNALPVVTLTLTDDAACVDEAAFALGGGSPAGGTYSGTGVTNPNFDPATAGVGSHTITYSYTDGNGCSSSATDNMTVNALPVVTLTLTDDAACVDEAAFALGGGSPAGGTYSGTGVTNPNFDPATAGVGSHTITYSYTDGNGCSNSATDNMTVNALPVVTLTLTDDAACVDEAAFALGGGSPAGGTYSGTGVTNPNFDPATAGVGSHTITYSYTDGNGCSSSATDNMTVNALPVVTLTLTDDAACVDEAAFALGGGSPAGGTYSGTGVTNPNFDPATAGVGSHTITYSYTDGNGCSSSATDNMTVNALPVVTLTLTDDAACVDEAAFALGGGSPAGGTYSGTGVTNPNFDPATAGVGSHTITYSYTDGNGCSSSATDNMTVNALPVVTLTLTDDAACVDEAAFALGGGSPAGGTYSGTGVTNPNFDPATAGVGSHTITYSYTDGNGCSSSATDNMTVNALPVVTLTLTDDAACVDEAAFALGGGSPAGGTYSGTGVTNPNFDPATAGVGSHTITYSYTDGNGCSSSATDNMTVNALPVVTLTLTDDAACVDEAAFALGGGSPAGGTYSGTGVTNPNFDPATAGVGSHTITYSYTDGNGCSSSATDNMTVNALPVVTLTLTDDAACVDEAAFALGGGSPAGGTYSGTGVTNPNFDPATAGVGSHTITYSYTDGNGCSSSATDNMTVNALPVVTLTLTDDAACVDEAAFALGGGSPAGGTYSGTGVTNPNFDPATAGVGSHTITYSYTDGNGCSSSATDNMTVNALPVVTLTLTDDAACVDESAFALGGGSPAGGTYSGTGVTNPNFDPATAGVGSHTITYSYTDGNGCSSSATDNMTVNALPVVTLASLSNICENGGITTLTGGSPAGGVYSGTGVTNPNFDPSGAGAGTHLITYTYSDGNGCTSSDAKNIIVDTVPVVSLSAFPDVCLDSSTFVLTQGTPSGGTYTGSGVSANQFTASNAGVGSHALKYKFIDGNGCTDSATANIVVDSLPILSLRTDTTICSGDSIQIGGKSGYTYAWQPGGETSQTIFAKSAGNYTLQITDGNGCKGSDVFVLGIDTLPLIELGPDSSICAGDSMLLDAGAGYSYAWVPGGESSQTLYVSNPMTYKVTITDGNQCSNVDSMVLTLDTIPSLVLRKDTSICNGDSIVVDAGSPYKYLWLPTNETTQKITVKTAGDYRVTITDGEGCINKDTFKLGIHILPSPGLRPDTTICASDSIQIGVGDWYTSYTWNNGVVGSDSIFVDSAFTYVVTVIDTNGCEGSDDFKLGIDTLPFVELGKDTSICVEGDYTLDAGPNAINYLWDNGTSLQTRDTKGAGVYFVKVTDGNMCSSYDTIRIDTHATPIPVINIQDTSICIGDSVILDAGAGYTFYSWTNNASTGQYATVKSTNTYILRVFDSNGCLGTDTSNVLVNNLPNVNLGGDQSVCDYKSIFVSVPETNAKSYTWSNGKLTQQLEITTSGKYYVDVVDTNNCFNSDTIVINPGPMLSIDLGDDHTICKGLSSDFQLTGYDYVIWNGKDTADSYSTNVTSSIDVLAIDSDGCWGRDTVDVSVSEIPVVSVQQGDSISICEKANDERELSINDAQGMTISWSDGSTGTPIIVTTPGEYVVTKTNEHGCEGVDTIEVAPYCHPIKLTMPNTFTPNNDGTNDDFIPLEIGHEELSYLMNNLEYVRFDVYDRWGVVMYTSTGVLPLWGGENGVGKQVPEGTYFWVLEYKDMTGTTYHSNGFVHVIR